MTPEINPFQYAREINASNTKYMKHTLFRMVDVDPRWDFPTRLHSQFALNNNKQDKHAICQSVRPTLAYIINHVKANKYIHGYNTHIYAHVLDKKWIFLLIKQRYNSGNLCHHFFEPEKLSSPLGPTPLQSSISQWQTWEEWHYVLQRDKGMLTQA